MKLLVDIGNSRIKWAELADAELRPGPPFAWNADPAQAPEVLEAEFARNWGRTESVSAVWIVNVAGNAIGDRVSDWCHHTWNLAPRFVHSVAAAHDVRNCYHEPGQLGADRFVAMVGARHDHKAAFCIVDCGTAVTIDAVNEHGEFLGGVIAPGIELMRRSLAAGTHALAAAAGEEAAADAFPCDTRSAIAAGTVHALAGCIEHVLKRFRVELGGEPICLLTGGEAAAISERIAVDHRYEPHLVLKGLAVFAEETT